MNICPWFIVDCLAPVPRPLRVPCPYSIRTELFLFMPCQLMGILLKRQEVVNCELLILLKIKPFF